MKTSKEYQKQVKEGIITRELLGDVLFSLNKRAKNMRDKEYYYYPTRNMYGYYDKYKAKKEEYYNKKDRLLAYATPTCIHKCIRQYEKREKVEVFEDEYDYIYVTKTKTEYFLFFELGNHSFHHPIKDITPYQNLEVTKLNHFETFGCDVDDLLSVPFCNKVLNGLEEKTLVLA